jgi:GntR family transcriptional regulator
VPAKPFMASAFTGICSKLYSTFLARVPGELLQIVMPQSRRNGIPEYKKIQRAILRRIEGGQLRPGDAVDSERELARIHGVSLMTARHALTGLEREGLVHRRRGAGTFVAPPKIHFNKLMSFTEQMSSRSLAACSRILDCSQIENEPEVSAYLGLSPAARLIRLERLRLAGDEPFAVEICYLAADEFPGLARAPLERGSLFSTLQQDYGVRLAYADEEVDATVADPRIAQLLAVPKGHALLRIRQIMFSTKGKPAVYVLGLYPSDRHTLSIRRFR